MPNSGLLLQILALLLGLTTADTSIHSKFQYPTTNLRDGCDSKIIVVSSNGCDADFDTIQGVINSLPQDTSSQTILVFSGNYIDQLNITRPDPLTVIGQTSIPDEQENNTVTVYWSAANANGRYTNNTFTLVLTVVPNLNASLTGSGENGLPVPVDTPFRCTDFRVYNIDFRNMYAELGVGPPLAGYLCREVEECLFLPNTIAGETDFLYGFGTAWVEKSLIQLRNCGGGIIAWKGTNTTFANKYGVYLSNPTVFATNSSIGASIVGKCFLERPWNAQMRAVYLDTYLDANIQGAGYERWMKSLLTWNWNNYTIMAQYEIYGPRFNLTKRIAGNLTSEFDAAQAAVYGSPREVFMTPTGEQPNVG